MDSPDYESSSSDEDEDSELDRPRFQGSAGVWYRYTAAERYLVTALDQQEAGDLSLHLYNVHALRILQNNDARPSTRKRRASSISTSNSEGSQVSLQPWASWPLDAADVPRDDEQHGAIEHFKRQSPVDSALRPAWTPSVDLRQELLALMLRKARSQLRQLQPTPVKLENSTKTDRPDTAGDAPQILIDDEIAERVLSPDIDTIMSKLDNLLFGLHKNRQGHRVHEQPQRSREQPRLPSPVENDLGDQKPSLPDGQHLRNLLAPRCWSDIVGLASLTGWSPAVVQRAAARCESLFGEQMTWMSSKITTPPDQGTTDAQDHARDLSCPVAGCQFAKASISTTRQFYKHMHGEHGWTKATIAQHLATTGSPDGAIVHVATSRDSAYLAGAVNELRAKRRKLRGVPPVSGSGPDLNQPSPAKSND